MKNYMPKIVVALVMTTLIIASAISISQADIAVGKKAPDFSMRSVSGGSDIKLSSFTDKPTLLVFYASWCPHCQKEAPTLQRLYTELGPKGLNVVGVDVDQQISDAQSFVKTYRISFPVAHGNPSAHSSTLDTYGISGVPTVYVLDKGGIVKHVYKGEAAEGTLKKDLAELGVK